jgi:intracellular multiplication protein IcmL
MTENELQEVKLEDNFYRDCFTKVILIAMSLLAGIVLMIVMAVYIQIHKPTPKVFVAGDEWRILPPVPVEQPYLSTAELSQWVMDVVGKVFMYDFNKYESQLAAAMPYFTEDGWQIFLNQLNIYANNNKVLSEKIFVSGEPSGAPIVTNEGLQAGRYVWLIQVPVDLNYTYAGSIRRQDQTLTLQLTVVRVPTLNNLSGVAIDNVEVVKSTEVQQGTGNANDQ